MLIFTTPITSFLIVTFVLQGLVRISAQSQISHLWLTPLLAKMGLEYPELHFDLCIRNARQLPDYGSFDISLVSGQLNDSSIHVSRLTDLPFVACATPTYLEKYGTPKNPEDLTEHYCLNYNYRETNNTWIFKQNKKIISVKVKEKITTNHVAVIYDAALQNAGIIYVPRFMVKKEIETRATVTHFNRI